MKLTKRTLAFLCTLIMVLQLFSGLSLASAEEAQVWKLADGVEIGKTYVIVADGKYAMTNEEVAGLRTYGDASTTRGAKEVTIADGVITSDVDDTMKWTFAEVPGFTAYDGQAVYHLLDSTGKLLRRGSASRSNAALILDNSVSKNARYYTWSAKAYEGLDATYCLYINSEQAYGKDYPCYLHGEEKGFDIPGGLQHRSESTAFDFMNAEACSHIQFYTLASDEGGDVETPIEHPELPIFENPEYSFKERAADLVARMNLTQKASQICSQNAPAIRAEQLGGGALNVPATKNLGGYTWWSETLHGCMGGVNYPQNTTVASTWNPELYYQESTNIGQEIRELKRTNLNFYSPTINMHRDPRWGRNEESYSEDVYLTAKMGTAWVTGLEGKNLDGTVKDPDGYLMAHSTIKHYVANNNEGASSGDTTGRLRAGAIGSLRALREYYALPYGEIIRNADVSSVMTAYSYYGIAPGKFDPSSYSSYLMDTLLREVYGFDGHITGDCDSVNSMQNLGYINPRTGKELTAAEALAGALAHGEDLECNGGHSSEGSGTSGFHTSYKAQINNMMGIETDKGTFTENTVDIALHRLMTARMETGDFDGDIQIKLDAANRNSTELRTSVRRPLVEQINAEGVVMLQNKDNFLPLNLTESGVKSVVIVGAWQTNGSTGLYAQASRNELNIQRGITEAIQKINSELTPTYITSNTLTDENKQAIAAADVAIVVCGTSSSYSQEDHDRTSTALPAEQETLVGDVADLNPNTVVVMETCGPMRVNRFQSKVKSILWSSFQGQWKTGFGAIITGAANPSGKTTDTWYNEVNDTGVSDVPAITDYELYPAEGKNGRTYMYYNGESKPSYPFGYGLSFTTFAYSNLKIDKASYDANDTVKVTFDVKNTGSVAGKEVTELYVAQPEAPAALKRPIKRLEGFQKVELQPGETKTITMEVKIEDLAFFDEAADCFVVDTGKYQVQVGTNSDAAGALTTDFTVSGKVTEVPAVITLKPNQDGDKALGIEQRLIYEKNVEVDPQITVAMNTEKLYGYIIKDQQSSIKQMKSCALPEGMTVTYKSNRPSVLKVEGDKIKTVAPGVATLTATVTYNGVTATGEAVIYVMTDISAAEITVDGKPVEKFSPDKYKYTVKLDSDKVIPVVAATAVNPALEVVVNQAAELPGEATVVITDPESGVSATYTIVFKVSPPQSGTYVLADTVEAGKQYVIVSNGYALTNEVANVSTAYGGVSLASTPVTVEGDLITSSVTPDMIWDFSEGTSSSNNGYETGYFLTCGDSKFLSRNGPTNGNPAPLNTSTYDASNVATKPQYCYWVVQDLDEEGNKAVFVTGTGEWTFALRGAEEGFDAPGNSNANTIARQNPVKLYELIGGLHDIDFTKPEDASKFDVINKDTAAIVEGEGVTLTVTADAFEPITSGWGEDATVTESTPKDLIKIPVAGDWTATLTLEYDVNGVQWAFNNYFALCAMQGEDYKNMAGIRGSNNVFQDFLRKDGTNAENIIPTPGFMDSPENGFTENGTYFLKLQKEGTTYTASWSMDGDEFTELFVLEDTGIEADSIIIDAYKTSNLGFGGDSSWKFILKYMEFEGGQAVPATTRPEVADITVDGKDIGFDPETSHYDIVVDVDSDKAPVVAATAGNAETTIEIEQLNGPFGTATVTATAGTRSKVYTVSFGHALQNDYFADGDYNEDLWTILNPDEETCAIEQGKGIVLPTQTANIYNNGTGWKNCFVTSAMSNWEAVTKVVFPVRPSVNYQQAQVLIWQDDDNYLRLNLQSQTRDSVPTLILEPGRESGGRFTAAATTTIEPAADNSVTVYFKFKKDGNNYTGAYSLDGETYTEILTAEGVSYNDPKLALFSSMNEEGEQTDTCYEYVYVVARDGLQPEFGEMLTWAAQNAADYMAASLPEKTAEALTVKAPHGYTVEFVTDNAAVIAKDGAVTPADKDTAVKVTVKVTEGDISASSKPVTITVPANGSAQPVLDKTELEAAIKEAEAVKKDEYTEETVKALDEALEAAKKALDEAKTQKELDDAAKALNDAIAALEKKPVLDKTALEKAIQDAEAVKKDDYTEETVKALDEALAAAKKALTDAKTQKELDDAAKALNDAIKALEKKPEDPGLKKDELEKAIEEAEKLDADKYTEESAKALAEAIEAAKKALEEAKTQAELDAAKKALDDAIAALVEKTEPTPTPTPHVCPGANFTDMPAVDYWSHAAIDWAIVNKITVGTSETTFGPTEGCTRAQVVTFLWRAAKEPAPTSKENPFKDVKESDYFYNAVLWAVEKGITVGTDPDKFSPGETCTRAQIVTFLYRYEGKPEVKPDDSFTDVKPGDYFADSVAWAVANGITKGTDPGKFSPSDTCTREQVVTFLYRDIAE